MTNLQEQNEFWKDIDGFEGLYLVSTLGRIKSVRNNAIMSQKLTKRGYLSINLSNKGKVSTFLVHRLVLIAFEGIDTNRKTVNHKHGIKTDNRLEELEWSTSSENIKHAFRTGLNKIVKGEFHAKSKPIEQRNADGSLIKTWSCVYEAARFFKVDRNLIKSVLKGKAKTSCGFKWNYL